MGSTTLAKGETPLYDEERAMPDSQVTFPSESLSLEGVLHLPAGEGPLPAVVVCHPHPRMGGNMHNNVVMAACWGLISQGIAALRFNFRGVGGSEGVSEAGDAEIADAVSALDYLRSLEEMDDFRLGIVGYSFGASVALQVATQGADVTAMGVIACPAPRLNEATSQELAMPKLFIAGDMDQAVPTDQFQTLTQRFTDPKEIHSIQGGDHFLWGHEQEISELVGAFFWQWLAQQGSRSAV